MATSASHKKYIFLGSRLPLCTLYLHIEPKYSLKIFPENLVKITSSWTKWLLKHSNPNKRLFHWKNPKKKISFFLDVNVGKDN